MRNFIALLFLVLPMAAQAITLVEGVDYADASPAVLGPLGVGTHEISGTLEGDCLGTTTFSCLFGSDPQDFLNVSFEAGAVLTGLSFELSNALPAAALFRMEFIYGSSAESFGFSGLLAGAYTSGPITPVSDPITLIFAGDTALPLVASYSADWSVTLEVAAVPLPGTVGLLAGALLGCAGLRRRFRRKA